MCPIICSHIIDQTLPFVVLKSKPEKITYFELINCSSTIFGHLYKNPFIFFTRKPSTTYW